MLKIKMNETEYRRVIRIKLFDKRQKKVSEFGTTMGTTNKSNSQ